MSKHLKPGNTAPASAQYEIVGPRGGRTQQERTVTTPRIGQGYIIADRTRNKAGRS